MAINYDAILDYILLVQPAAMASYHRFIGASPSCTTIYRMPFNANASNKNATYPNSRVGNGHVLSTLTKFHQTIYSPHRC